MRLCTWVHMCTHHTHTRSRKSTFLSQESGGFYNYGDTSVNMEQRQDNWSKQGSNVKDRAWGKGASKYSSTPVGISFAMRTRS